MQYQYDIRGNLLLIKDPYGRNVFEHCYDLRAPQKGEDGKEQPLPPLWTKHIDKGISTILFDVVGKPVESEDAKGAQALSGFDVTSRPKYAWAKNKAPDNFTLRGFIEYGDSSAVSSPETYNLNGQPYKNYDEAGMKLLPLYDFKGNLLSKQQWIISTTELKTKVSSYSTYIVDWTGLPNILDSQRFISDMEYDALNRVTKFILPEDVATTRKEITPAYNKAGALQQVSYDGTVYVENMVYDAKGQRLLIAFGNGMMTRYAYDTLTFRLLRQRSEKYTKSTVGNTVTYAYNSGTNKQDDGFKFDLVGNIMTIMNRVTDCGINGSLLGDDALDRNFSYDSIYRLLSAYGRESDTQSGDNYLYDDAPAPGSPNANHVRAYDRAYQYDKLGNVKQVKQIGSNGFTRDFKYNNGKNTLQRIDDASPAVIEDYTYDDCGNQLTAGSTRNYVWNHADQLICYRNQAGPTPTVFTQYDYSGQDRVSKLVRTGSAYERTIYIDGIFEYVKLEDGTDYEKNYIHIMDDSSRIAEVRINIGAAFPNDIADDVVYNLEDQIGSSSVRLDTNGTIIDKEEYYPFGDSSLRTFTYKRHRYVGKERDAESGLYYYGARYYAAWTCRFISVDPLADKYIWQSSYVYGDNNPVNKIDYNGEGTGDGDKKQSAANSGSGPKPTGPYKDPDGYEGKAADNDRVYHCGTYDNNGNISIAEGYYKWWDYQKYVNKSYEYHYTASAPDPHSFTTGGKIVSGIYTAMVHNIIGTAKFGKGLLTGESYGQAWSGLKTAGNFINPWSEKGNILRTQAYSWAANAKNWDAYDWSYGTTTVGLSLLTTKGISSTLKPIISNYAYNSKLLGYNSHLFGIGRNGFRQGIWNQGVARAGWSYIKNTHEHVFRIGIGHNSKYYPKTVIFGIQIHKHINILKTPATF